MIVVGVKGRVRQTDQRNGQSAWDDAGVLTHQAGLWGLSHAHQPPPSCVCVCMCAKLLRGSACASIKTARRGGNDPDRHCTRGRPSRAHVFVPRQHLLFSGGN